MSHQGEGKAVLVISQFSHNLSVFLSNYYSAKNRSSRKWSTPAPPSFWHDFVPHFPYASSCAWVGGGAGWRNADSLTLFSFRPHHSLFFVLSNNASLTKQIEKIPSCGCCSMPCVARHLSHLAAFRLLFRKRLSYSLRDLICSSKNRPILFDNEDLYCFNHRLVVLDVDSRFLCSTCSCRSGFRRWSRCLKDCN